jgi:hypothetical protein
MLTVQLDAVDRDLAAESGLRDVVRRIRSARRIVVVCGEHLLQRLVMEKY